MLFAENGDSNRNTRAYFDSILVETRLLDSGLADTRMELFGQVFETPVMMAALSHLDSCRADGMAEMARGALQAGAVNWAGMGDNEELMRICATGAGTVKIIKPYADEDQIFSRLQCARECGCLAAGMDIDHAFGHDGDFDELFGLKMNAKSTEDIRRYVQAAQLPFVVKGVLSVHDAVKCAEAGVSGIVVSHHHGIMPCCMPPLALLKDIRTAVGKEMKIFVDCGVENGYDVFKALALGADAVSMGRTIMPDLHDQGASGVYARIVRATNELKTMMARTGARTLREIDPTVIHAL